MHFQGCTFIINGQMGQKYRSPQVSYAHLSSLSLYFPPLAEIGKQFEEMGIQLREIGIQLAEIGIHSAKC